MCLKPSTTQSWDGEPNVNENVCNTFGHINTGGVVTSETFCWVAVGLTHYLTTDCCWLPLSQLRLQAWRFSPWMPSSIYALCFDQRFSKKITYWDRKTQRGLATFSKYPINYRSRKTEEILFFLERICQMLQLANALKLWQANLEIMKILEVKKSEKNANHSLNWYEIQF